MSISRFKVASFTGDCRAQVAVPSESTIGQARPQILESLNLDLAGSRLGNEEQTWILCNESATGKPFLSDTQIVGDVIRDGQQVRVLPTIIAGRQRTWFEAKRQV